MVYYVQNSAYNHSQHTFMQVARNALYKEVAYMHPELALCDRYWKIEHVARDRYPSWASSPRGDETTCKTTKAKSEDPSLPIPVLKAIQNVRKQLT